MILSILNEISDAKGTKKKVAILESHKDNKLLQAVWHITYSRSNLGTSVIQKVICDSSRNSEQGDFLVLSLLESLRDKVVTGNDAKVLITNVLTGLHPDCIELYNRIIKGNLKCGIGFTAGATVYGKQLFKTYPVMLISAHCNKKAARIVSEGAVMQLKSDGVRGIAESDESGDVLFFSRQGEKFHGLDKFIPYIQEIKNSIIDNDGILSSESSLMSFDGEFCVIIDGIHMPNIASGILNSCIHGTASEEDIEKLTFVVWDSITNEPITYSERLYNLQCAFKDTNTKDIQLVDSWEVDSLEDVHDKYSEIVRSGNEGVVLKSLLNIWKDKRVTDCIKYKEKHSASLEILSYYYGESGKEFQNVLGGFSIASSCGTVLSNTGSGLSLSQRGVLSEGIDSKGKPIYKKDSDGNYKPVENIESFLESYVSSIVEIEYNKRTKTRNVLRETFSLRFPIIKHFRCDKISADSVEGMIEEEFKSYGLKV